MAAIPYPITINGLFLPILSLQYPETTFNNDAVLSAIPSIKDIVVLDAPIDNKNMGITLYTILVEVSVKKLVSPVKKAFLSNPNIFLFSFIILVVPAVSFLRLPNLLNTCLRLFPLWRSFYWPNRYCSGSQLS
ncbi:hypothetical protein MASR2M47_46620 [Draconibacterium sp.]